MAKLKLGIIVFLSVLLISPAALVLALYGHEPIINVLDSNGYFCFQEFGIKAIIRGTPGANCTIQTYIYSGNPQPTASIPDGISLTQFGAVAITMNTSQFTNVSITLNITKTNLQNIQPPYAVYEYVQSTNSYEKLPSTVVNFDAADRTITFTQTNLIGLFAIGGAPVATITVGEGAIMVLLILVSVVVSIVVAVLIVIRFKRVTSTSKMK